MIDDFPFELTPSEKSHPFWIRLKAHLQDRLALQRSRNDADHDPTLTATIRGHIKCLKAIIALGDDRPPTGDE